MVRDKEESNDRYDLRERQELKKFANIENSYSHITI